MKVIIRWTILIIVVLIVYVLIFVRRLKKNRSNLINFQDSLKVGDIIEFSGGICGTICYFEDKWIGVEICDNTVIKVDKYRIEKIIS